MRPEWDILPPILLSVVRRFDGRFEKEDIQLLLDKGYIYRMNANLSERHYERTNSFNEILEHELDQITAAV